MTENGGGIGPFVDMCVFGHVGRKGEPVPIRHGYRLPLRFGL